MLVLCGIFYIHYWRKQLEFYYWNKNTDTILENLFSYKIRNVDNTRKPSFISNKENTDINALSQFSLLQKWRQKLHKLRWTLNKRWKTHKVTYISWQCVWKDAEGRYIYTMHTFFRNKAERWQQVLHGWRKSVEQNGSET